MKIWLDDVRPAPEGYVWIKSVDEAKKVIEESESPFYFYGENITLINIDHDAGAYSEFGGDYIKLLDWLEETGRNYPIHIHSMNTVGIENMRRIIQKNGWIEVK